LGSVVLATLQSWLTHRYVPTGREIMYIDFTCRVFMPNASNWKPVDALPAMLDIFGSRLRTRSIRR